MKLAKRILGISYYEVENALRTGAKDTELETDILGVVPDKISGEYGTSVDSNSRSLVDNGPQISSGSPLLLI